MNRIQGALFVLVFILVPTFALNACKPAEPIACDAIREPIYDTFPATDTDSSVIRNWIKEHYAAIGVSLSEGSDVTGQTWFSWSTNQKSYQAAVDRHGSGLVVKWLASKPMLREVINCLGEPDYYTTEVVLGSPEGPIRQVNFDIWYPARRLVISTSQPGTTLTVNDSTSFEVLTVTWSSTTRPLKAKSWPNDTRNISVDP